ncbi:MAG: peptidylprolyl isomerase [Chloroflexi bacterium]|nr:peptidylprolyl isomerase [Chloroflexota bacterium]
MANQSHTPKIVTKKHIARQQREATQTRIITAVAVTGIAAAVLLIVYGYLKLNVFALREPVAEVNGEVITTGQWQQRVKLERVRELNLYQTYLLYQQSFGMDTSQQQQEILMNLGTPSIIGQQVLDQMIEELIIRQEAKKLGITVSAEEVEASIQESYSFFPNGTPSPTITPTDITFPTMSSAQLTLYPSTATPTKTPVYTVTPTNTPDPAMTSTPTATAAPPTPTFVPELATATPTPYTLEGFQSEFNKSIENLKSYGIEEETLRSIYEFQLIRKKLLEAVTADTPRTDEQVWARHILVEDPSLAGVVYSLLKNGNDFAATARKYSKDTGSGANGGDLGWFGRGTMVAEFEEAAFSQPVGEIGEVVRSQFGYHIIQVLGKADLPLTDSQYEQKRETAFTEWLAAIKESASITTYDIWQDRIPTEPQQLNTPTP